MRLIAILAGAAILMGILAWVGLDAAGARYIATHCRAQGQPGAPPAGETLVHYTPDLPAWFAPPLTPGLPTIVMVPGYGGDRRDSGGFASAMAKRGYGILRIDRSCDHSSSAYGGGPREAAEVLQAVEYTKHNTRNGPVVLFGFSAGGAEALLAVDRGAPVEAVITDSAPSNLLNIVKDWHNLPPSTYRLTPLLYRLFSKNGHLSDLEHDLSGRHTVPTLIIQGEGDTDVTPSNAPRLARLTHGQLWFVPGANHGEAFAHDPGAYVEQATTFLDTVLTKASR